MPIILIGISACVLFVFANPIYGDITALRAQVSSFDEALNNSKALENERDKLTAKYNALNPDDLAKIQKLLPDNIDNIRLILEIEKIALPYGMVLRDVKYDVAEDSTSTNVANTASGIVPQGGRNLSVVNRDYGTWDLEFSTSGTYNNFLNFTRDLESNLRIVDISSIQFSSSTSLKINSADAYTYSFKIKTYWLKN